MTLYDGTTNSRLVDHIVHGQPKYEQIEWRACTACMFLVAYGEFDDGEDTDLAKWSAWNRRGISSKFMSVACEGECDHSFTTDDCELCGDGYDNTLHDVVQLVPVDSPR